MRSQLRRMKDSDLEKVLSWRNNSKISKYMYNQHTINIKEHREWFFKAAASSDIELLIFELDGHSRGFMQFKKEIINNAGKWGFYLSPDAPKGIGRIMGNHGLEYAFKKLDFENLYAEAIEHNVRSINFHLNLGFSIEKKIKKTHFDGLDYHNIISFVLSKKDWQQNIGRKH